MAFGIELCYAIAIHRWLTQNHEHTQISYDLLRI